MRGDRSLRGDPGVSGSSSLCELVIYYLFMVLQFSHAPANRLARLPGCGAQRISTGKAPRSPAQPRAPPVPCASRPPRIRSHMLL